MTFATPNAETGRMLCLATINLIARNGGEAMQLDEADRFHEWKMVKRGRFAFVEKPKDARLPRRIDCYAIKETRGDTFRLDPKRKLFSLHNKKDDNPPDLHLMILQPWEAWLAEVMLTLFTALDMRG